MLIILTELFLLPVFRDFVLFLLLLSPLLISFLFEFTTCTGNWLKFYLMLASIDLWFMYKLKYGLVVFAFRMCENECEWIEPSNMQKLSTDVKCFAFAPMVHTLKKTQCNFYQILSPTSKIIILNKTHIFSLSIFTI